MKKLSIALAFVGGLAVPYTGYAESTAPMDNNARAPQTLENYPPSHVGSSTGSEGRSAPAMSGIHPWQSLENYPENDPPRSIVSSTGSEGRSASSKNVHPWQSLENYPRSSTVGP